MNGDFSQWRFDPAENYDGVLHQQGRVLLDQDWNASSAIERHQRAAAARDAFGANVAAVPASAPQSLKVTTASASTGAVQVTLSPGTVWADGIRVEVGGTTPITRTATYLAPPLQSPQASPTTIAAGIRDAVILDVWQESFSAFQDPASLIEPALGGPDTTERVKTAYALRLLRLLPGDECGNLDSKLADVFGAKGKLTVTPSANVVVAGDCPVQMGGGYTGFEHFLYRIEIAEPLAGVPRFKWSQFNGGLVGRGAFTSTGGTTGTVAITANDQAINHCGLTSFYLEALQFDTALGYWRVVLSANATLPQDGSLSLSGITGTWPATSPASGFFRLWNGLAPVTDFPLGPNPKELKDGIQLQLDAPAAGNYTPGDYWTFPVRAAGVAFDASTWPNAAPPHGVRHHRVPLAVLNWTAAPNVTIAGVPAIHDCRLVFQPLTRQKGCCYYRVGDNTTSFGDFATIQAAIDALPAEGGEVCVLPGLYPESVTIEGRKNVRLHGCGKDSVIQPVSASPAIRLADVQAVTIESLRVLAHEDAQAILVEGKTPSEDVVLTALDVEAAKRSTIEVRGAERLEITHSRMRMEDVATPWPAVFVIARDALIRDNTIVAQRSDDKADGASAAPGGLQLGGACERVRVVDNLIHFGIGNGITLGSLEEVDADGEVVGTPGGVVNTDGDCGDCTPGDTSVPPGPTQSGTTLRSAGSLYEIAIEANRIFNMGLNGIGVVGFFDLKSADEFITVVRLDIVRNEIRGCLRRPLAAPSAAMLDASGYGGIALADVEYLVIQDNLVEGNGPSHLEPVCGIFVLHGEGIDISRNRVLHNGAKTVQTGAGAKQGRRGGINIVYGVANTTPVTILNTLVPRQDGVPAIRIHDNIVSHPLGQALSLGALGPVSVVGNQLTSFGVISQQSSPTFLAGCVAITNLGTSNEVYLQLATFSGVANGQVDPGPDGTPDVTDDIVSLPRAGLDDARVGQYLANGNVLFNDNQCLLDLTEQGLSLAMTSIFIMTLDDIGFDGNQCECNLLDDLILTQVVLFGFSVRMSDNRMKEGVLNALFSAMTLGLFNATTDNQSTHCLLTGAQPSLKVVTGNRSLFDLFAADICTKLAGGIGQSMGAFK